MHYAGIGSRDTPTDILLTMERIAVYLAGKGWVLRSGHAPGADRAFERGAGEQAEIFLPWQGFGGESPIHGVPYVGVDGQALEMAERFHPSWATLSEGGRKLHARNCYQILGRHLNNPSALVVCWTPDGSLDGTGRNTGGTGQALRIAKAFGVHVHNLRNEEELALIEGIIRS